MKDLKLNNGATAKYLYTDDWDRPVYFIGELGNEGKHVCCVNLNGTYLHTMSGRYGEPECPLSNEWQPIAEA